MGIFNSLLFLSFICISPVWLTRKSFFRISTILLCICGIGEAVFAEVPELSGKNQKDFVYGVLPYPLEFVHAHISLQFDSNERAFFEDYNTAIYQLPGNVKTIRDLSEKAYKKFMAFPIVRQNKFYVFYGAYPNMQHAKLDITPYSVAGMDNPALERYSRLSPELRTKDIYLWSPDTPFWYSEYASDGVAVPFRTYFIIHLAEIDKHHTEVEIIEDRPVVKMGRKFSVDSHGVIHRYDIRDVAPTTADREYLLSCINQFIDRNIPGRHWFNCK